MAKLVTFFILGLLIVGIIGAVQQGGGGVTTTRLTTDIDHDDMTVPVVSTANFLNMDYVLIDNEKILYSSKDATNFYVATNGRGYDSTPATDHDERTNVHSAASGIVNSMAGYNVSIITEAAGIWAVFTLPLAIFRLMANALYINFTYLGSDLAIISYIWIALGVGLIVTIVIQLVSGRRVA